MGFNNHDGNAKAILPPSTYSRPADNSAGKTKPFAGAKYWACQKNHAAGLGKHVVDGCGEFMAAGEEGTIEALGCAACTCHRNFHRKEVEGSAMLETPPPPNIVKHSPNDHTPAVQPRSPVAGAMPLTPRGSGTRYKGDHMSNPVSYNKKMKDKMLSFTESVGRQIGKKDEAVMQEARVTRHMLGKQNNKHTLGNKP